jgi:hypothetical protein
MKPCLNKFVLSSFVLLLLASCVPSPEAPPPTPIPSFTSVPSPIPTDPPTVTPSPTQVVPEIRIREPISGGEVELKTTIKGISQNLPAGSVIWIVIYLPLTNRYYPTNEAAVVQVNGEWSALAQFGQEGETGLKADVIVVLANQDVQDAFIAYLTKAIADNDYPGMEGLPLGDIVYDRISVTRK